MLRWTQVHGRLNLQESYSGTVAVETETSPESNSQRNQFYRLRSAKNVTLTPAWRVQANSIRMGKVAKDSFIKCALILITNSASSNRFASTVSYRNLRSLKLALNLSSQVQRWALESQLSPKSFIQRISVFYKWKLWGNEHREASRGTSTGTSTDHGTVRTKGRDEWEPRLPRKGKHRTPARFNVLVLNGRHPGSPGGSRASAVETSRARDPYRSRRTIVVEQRDGQWMRMHTYTRDTRRGCPLERDDVAYSNVIFDTKLPRFPSRTRLSSVRLSNRVARSNKKRSIVEGHSMKESLGSTRFNGYPKSKVVKQNENGSTRDIRQLIGI